MNPGSVGLGSVPYGGGGEAVTRPTLLIDVLNNLSLSENDDEQIVTLVPQINKQDSLSLSESRDVFTPFLSIVKSEILQLTESRQVSISAALTFTIDKSDSIKFTELVQALTPVVELNKFDSITLQEFVNASVVSASALTINVFDTLNAVEYKDVKIPLAEINKNELIKLIEYVNANITSAITATVNVEDSISIDESVTWFSPEIRINRSESITLTETRSLSTGNPANAQITVNDLIKLTEDVNLFNPDLRINIFDNITFNELAIINSGSTDFIYLGDLNILLEPTSSYSADYAVTGSVSILLTPESDVDGKFNYSGTVQILIKAPDTGVVQFTSFPYEIRLSIYIDGVDYSDKIEGIASVTRQDNAASICDITISDETKKPSEFLNKEIKVAFQAADENGLVADYIRIFIGVIKRVQFNESDRALNLSGYDYGGVHSTAGEYISRDITPVQTGQIFITGTGNYNIGKSPIWGVTYLGTDDIIDGRDFFVNSLTGIIVVPITSNFNITPGGLSYNYAEPFTSLKALIENIVSLKGWSLLEDGVVLTDYSQKEKQPVVTISNESIIDITRKFLELSGAKCESNLYPDLRLYSETENVIGSDIHSLTEDDYFEDSLDIEINLDELITKQTVRSVAKTLANIQISGSEEIANESGVHEVHVLFDTLQQYSTIYFESLTRKTVAEVRISKANIASVSHVATGTYALLGDITNIQNSDWEYTIEENEIVYKLNILPIINTSLFARVIVAYPKVNWTLVVNGTKIEYGEGTTEQTVEVTNQRTVIGVGNILEGDVYENPYIETSLQAEKLCNAMLTESGHFYTMNCEVPLYKAKNMELGEKINVKRNNNIIFKGIIKTLAYSLDSSSANSAVGIMAKGIGFDI